MKSFRLLNADEIDVRTSYVTANVCSLLLYKDARVDMNILDDAFGINGWQRSHQVIDGNLYCTVSVWDSARCAWISKQDVGTESNTEKEKGAASDSFKRACFNWGIGRELYSAPQILVYAQNGGFRPVEKNGKYGTYDRFSVSEIEYDANGNISYLLIKNTTLNKDVFEWGA